MNITTDILTVYKDRESGTWSYRIETIVNGMYKGLTSWWHSTETKYTDFRRKAAIQLPPLKRMEKDENYWFISLA